jgi:hypothetical protein
MDDLKKNGNRREGFKMSYCVVQCPLVPFLLSRVIHPVAMLTRLLHSDIVKVSWERSEAGGEAVKGELFTEMG